MVQRDELQRWLTRKAWIAIGGRLHLSNRECEVVQGVVADRTDLAIGRELSISPHTVHTYLVRVYHKLGVSSRIELMRRVMQCYLSLAADPDSHLPPNCDRHHRGECPFDN